MEPITTARRDTSRGEYRDLPQPKKKKQYKQKVAVSTQPAQATAMGAQVAPGYLRESFDVLPGESEAARPVRGSPPRLGREGRGIG